MKRVVALLLIASVALFAAVAPQSSLKNAGTPMVKLPTAEIKAEPLQVDNADVRTSDFNMSKASALTVDSSVVTIVYLEDFENGSNGWTQYDATAPDPLGAWHLSDFGGTDSLWWCADLSLGGYISNWHVALETPEVTLTPGDSTLSFYMDLNCETPGGEEAPYDGWDGANVQISIDSGATWTVLNPTTVPYNCTSLYSFGYQFNSPAPGWGGVHEGTVEVDLGDYIGETVSIRFVFASDGAFDTYSEPLMYGMFIDSIDVAGDAQFNGSVNDGLVSYAINSAKGSYWVVDDRTDSIPSPTHVLHNWVEADSTYARNLEDYYVSPSITLPNEPATLIYCDFEFYADFADETGEFPAVDFWRLEVSPDDGMTWNAISNPYGLATEPNYVYSTGIQAWLGFQYAYGETCNLTDYAGQTLKFRFYFKSDEDTPMGGGLLIDDFVVYSQPDLPVVQDVSVAMNANDNVEITWQNMDGTYQLPQNFIATYPEECVPYYGPSLTFFGDDSTTGYGMGMEYSTNGKDITFTSLDFALYNMNPLSDKISVALFGLVDNAWSNVLYWSDSFVPDTVDTMQSIDISAVSPTFNGDVRVMVFWETHPSFPTMYLNTDVVGDMRLYVPDGQEFLSAPYSTPIGVSGYGEVTYTGLKYNVYRLATTETVPVLVAEGLTTNSFVDEDASTYTEYYYFVTCSQGDFVGSPSELVKIFVTPAGSELASYDDGTAEDILELGMDTTVVIKITPSKYPAKLEAIRFAALWAGDAYKVKIFKDDEEVPGDSWLLVEPQMTAIEGWNTFKVPNNLTADNGNGIVLRDGESVWIGVKGNTYGYPAWLGADGSSEYSGLASMQTPGNIWTSNVPFLKSNPMIRGYFDVDVDTTAISEIVPTEYELAQNYPNPFNPITTIHFELKNSGMTKVDIFDVSGRHVRTLLNGTVDAGAYDLKFDASALSSGVYFYRLTSGLSLIHI